MWRITAVAGLAAVMAIAALSSQTTSVHACTPPGPDFDAYTSSSLIIEGRINGWSVRSEFADWQIAPIDLDMNIERVWKGQGGRSVRIEVHDTLQQQAGEDEWGPCCLCGIFHEDPTGDYIIFGLNDSDNDGTYSASAFSVFFRGDEPEGDEYEAAVARLTSRQAATILPSTGSGPASPAATNHLVAAVAALGTALLAASFAIRFGTGKLD